MPRYQVVASVENNPYMVWQAMLFHASCVRHLGQSPIIVVHMDDGDLLSGYRQIEASGGCVQIAPTYRRVNGVNYPPRNTAASLRHVDTDADAIVLCDPDMVFLQPIDWDSLGLSDRQVNFDRVGYLDANVARYQPAVDNVCIAAGIDPSTLRNPNYNGGVPHVIPMRHRRELSDSWLELMELFPDLPPCGPEDPGARPRECHIGPQKDWLCTMWALAMSVERLGLEPVLTDLCITTQDGERPLPALEPTGPFLIHYCYDSAGFRKHQFDTLEAATKSVWQLPGGDGTVSGAIREELRHTCEFYGLA
jgi:hypothetical protein